MVHIKQMEDDYVNAELVHCSYDFPIHSDIVTMKLRIRKNLWLRNAKSSANDDSGKNYAPDDTGCTKWYHFNLQEVHYPNWLRSEYIHQHKLSFVNDMSLLVSFQHLSSGA